MLARDGQPLHEELLYAGGALRAERFSRLTAVEAEPIAAALSEAEPLAADDEVCAELASQCHF